MDEKCSTFGFLAFPNVFISIQLANYHGYDLTKTFGRELRNFSGPVANIVLVQVDTVIWWGTSKQIARAKRTT